MIRGKLPIAFRLDGGAKSRMTIGITFARGFIVSIYNFSTRYFLYRIFQRTINKIIYKEQNKTIQYYYNTIISYVISAVFLNISETPQYCS